MKKPLWFKTWKDAIEIAHARASKSKVRQRVSQYTKNGLWKVESI